MKYRKKNFEGRCADYLADKEKVKGHIKYGLAGAIGAQIPSFGFSLLLSQGDLEMALKYHVANTTLRGLGAVIGAPFTVGKSMVLLAPESIGAVGAGAAVAVSSMCKRLEERKNEKR